VSGPLRHGVGSLFRLKLGCLGNDRGALGVCYEVWERGGGGRGVSVISANGRYDGFSAREAARFLEPAGRSADPAIAAYRFVNVLALEGDFRRGVFAPAFRAGRARDENPGLGLAP